MSSRSGSEVISGTSSKEMIVLPDKRHVRLHFNSGLFVTSMFKSDSFPVGDGTSEFVK